MGESVEGAITFWANVNTVALIAAALAGAVTIAAGLKQNSLNDLAQADLKAKVAQANRQAAEANQQAEEAHQQAAEAKQRTAELVVRAAELETQAAEARAETERIKERIQGLQKRRRLTKAQAEGLAPVLKALQYNEGDPAGSPRLQVGTVTDTEAEGFARDFLDLFIEHKINVSPTRGGRPLPFEQFAPHPTGLMLKIGAPSEPLTEFQALAVRMAELGIPVQLVYDPELLKRRAILVVLHDPARA